MDPISGIMAVGALGKLTYDVATGANKDKRSGISDELYLMNRQKEHQYDLMDYQQGINYLNWQNENQYNSPSAQRGRLEAAGLNGGLLMSQGNNLGTGSSVSPVSGGSAAAAVPFSEQVKVMKHQQMREDALAVAQAGLMSAQAFKTKKEADLVDSQNSGMKLQNEYDVVRNTLFKKYGELEKKIGLNYTDAQTSLADSQRLVNNTVEKLNLNELYSLRPEQAAKLVADTSLSQSQDLLAKVQSAKTDEERKLLIKRFILEQSIAASTIALNYANARSADAQASAWSPNGVLFELNKSLGDAQKFKNDNNITLWNSGFTDKQGVYQTFGHYYINAIMNSVQSSNLANGLIIKTLGSPSEFRSQVFELYRLFGRGATPLPITSPFQ